MSNDVAARLRTRPSPLQQAFEVFLRAVAFICLVEGIAYWVRLMGFFEGAIWRFDLMPFYWQVAAVPLAVLFPFAAVGLWLLTSWGAVMWILCAAAEIVMYGAFPELYGHRPWFVGMQVFVIVCYAGLRVSLYWRHPGVSH